jgi:acid phosphatase
MRTKSFSAPSLSLSSLSLSLSLPLALSLCAGLSTAPLLAGCAAGPADPNASRASDDEVGAIGLQLQVAFGFTLNTIGYQITGPAGFSRTGVIDVTNSATVTAVVGGLPFGAGYEISLNGTLVDGKGTCAGSARFDIDSAATKPVSVHIACVLAPIKGSILVNGTLNVCARIDSVDASPAEVTVGGVIGLGAAAVDVDHGPSPLAYQWTTTAGTLAGATSASATLTCTAPGSAIVTVTVSDGDAACSAQSSVTLTCSDPATNTPIKHVIVLIGENRTFDHVFGTYVPQAGQSVSNLLSKGIVNADGTPGPNFRLAAQSTAQPESAFYIAAASKTPYDVLPPPTTGGSPTAPRDTAPPFVTVAEAAAFETDLAPADLVLLTTGATGLATRVPDTRVTNALMLPGGPFQLTGPTMPYDAYTGDSTHRFYQMWQQSDCSLTSATADNPAGCVNDLYPFVITSFSTANNGTSNSMAFFNVANGDAPFLKSLADTFTMTDNFHQSVQGGTGANHSMIGFGDAFFWTDGLANPATPPAALIANPNPRPGTNNNYTVDGNFSNCSDPAQPGVGPIVSYLGSLPYHPNPNCAPGAYYLLNNTNPAYTPAGVLKTTGTFTPPSRQRSIGDALSEKSVSWRFYGGAFNKALAGGAGYCQICNPFEFQTSIMADVAARTEHLKDTVDMYTDIANGTLPAVSFAHPDGALDGHPQSSKLGLFEAYVRNILAKLDGNPQLKASTVVLVTFDEGGGYYDSGFIQPVDFFGDGPRIPLIAVSPYSKGGKVVHSYGDHVSILKFIERNWALQPITARSRDNLPNPQAAAANPYVPLNMPAIGDLYDLFDFTQFNP